MDLSQAILNLKNTMHRSCLHVCVVHQTWMRLWSLVYVQRNLCLESYTFTTTDRIDYILTVGIIRETYVLIQFISLKFML